MFRRSDFAGAGRVIVKIGSALLTGGGHGLDRESIAEWVRQIAELRQHRQVVLVSSGSVVEGMTRLGWNVRPSSLHELQAAASVGQMGLVRVYESLFLSHGLHSAQVLLTHDDLSNRQRYLNARSTLTTLLELGVVPVINENDAVATEEIRFGDNDTLAALVANALEADLLIILTDQLGLYDRNPSVFPEARLIGSASIADPKLGDMVGESLSGLGRGGMITKLRAARLAARSGTATVIAGGREPNVIPRILDGDDIGTHLVPDVSPMVARKRWLAGQLKTKGALELDEGAARVLLDEGKSLLPVGVKRVDGAFGRGDLVSCLDPEGKRIALGLINYSSDEVARIMGKPSSRIADILGYIDEPELIHRDNLVVSL
jgi:glutamate 5-kinase